MAYNIRDVIGFPPPSRPTMFIDWQSLCDSVDMSVDYPVVYAFGGNAPTVIKMVNGEPLRMSASFGYARAFIEMTAYYWNPASPDWNGQ